MILRIDRLPVDLPIPDSPNANAASAVQELMGGKFGDLRKSPPRRNPASVSRWTYFDPNDVNVMHEAHVVGKRIRASTLIANTAKIPKLLTPERAQKVAEENQR